MVISDIGSSSRVGNRKKNIAVFFILFIIPFAVRFAYLLLLKHSFLLDVPIIDADYYYKWAAKIAGGDLIGRELFAEGPLAPYMIAPVFALFGKSIFNAVLLQSILGSVNCVLIFLIAKRIFNSAVGVISWLICALFPYFIFLEGVISNEPFILFFNSISVLLIYEAYRRKRGVLWLLSGIAIGISSLGRPNIFLVLILVFLWLCFIAKEINLARKLTYSLLIILGVLIVLIPVGARNYAVGKRFVITTSSAGINFWIGNGPGATGTYRCPDFCVANPFYEHESFRREASKRMNTELDAVQTSVYWVNDTLRYVIANPLTWLGLIARKLYYVFSGCDIPNNASYFFFRDQMPLLRSLFVDIGLIMPIGLAGVIFAFPLAPGASLLLLFITGYTLNNLIVFVSSEYRAPMLPFIIIFAASLVHYWFAAKKEKRFIGVSAGKILSVVLVVLLLWLLNLKTWWPMKSYANHYEMLGISYFRNDKFDDALGAFATAQNMGYNTPSLHFYSGYSYSNKNMLEQALNEFKIGMTMDPNDWNCHRETGKIYMIQKKYTQAREMFEGALKRNPEDAESYAYLDTVYKKEGMKVDARHQKALKNNN